MKDPLNFLGQHLYHLVDTEDKWTAKVQNE